MTPVLNCHRYDGPSSIVIQKALFEEPGARMRPQRRYVPEATANLYSALAAPGTSSDRIPGGGKMYSPPDAVGSDSIEKPERLPLSASMYADRGSCGTGAASISRANCAPTFVSIRPHASPTRHGARARM